MERSCMGRKMIHHSPPKHPEQADPYVQMGRDLEKAMQGKNLQALKIPAGQEPQLDSYFDPLTGRLLGPVPRLPKPKPKRDS